MKKGFEFARTLFLMLLLAQGDGLAQQYPLELPKPSDTIFQRLQNQLEASKTIPGTPAQAAAHLALGEYYHSLGLYSEALEVYDQALGLLGEEGERSLLVPLNNNIGKVYLSLNDFGQAEQYFSRTIREARALNDPRALALSLGLMGAVHEKRGRFAEALEMQLESLSLFEGLADAHGLAMTYEHIGSIHEDLEDFALAHFYFDRAHQYLKGTATPEEVNVINNLADTYRKRGEYPKALELTGTALSLALEIQDLHQSESAHKDLSKTYALMGDFKQAHHHLSQSVELGNSLYKAQNFNQINLLSTIYENDRKEVEIELLKKRNKLSEANQRLLWVAFFALAVILGLLYLDLGRRKKAELKVQRYRQRTLKAELEKKAIEEKNLQREVQLKTVSLSRYSLHLSQKNKILSDLANTLRNIAERKHMNATGTIKGLVKEIDFNLQQEQEWDVFMDHFREIHPEFIKKLSSLSDHRLSPAELRLGMLLRLNLSSKEIAEILRIGPDSVRVARHRLRKKLPIDPKEELVHFMIEL